MALTKNKKAEIIAKVKEVAKAPSIVFANFHGLTVLQASELRKTLREKNVGYVVAKKTLVRKALEEAGFQGTMPEFPGELALAWSEDLVAPASGIFEFQKKFDKKVKIVGGVFEGMYKNEAEMTEIAAIPGLQTLRGMFVNLINSPIQGLAIVLSAIADKKGGQA